MDTGNLNSGDSKNIANLNNMNLPKKQNIINNDEDDNLIDVTPPEQYSELTEIINSESLPDGHYLLGIEQIKEYFDHILSNDSRIRMINGLVMNGENESASYYCDYYRTSVGDDYYYCLDCNNDMCNLCFAETSEAIAKANGAKNYAKRKDKLSLCQTKHTLKKRQLSLPAICDFCEGKTNQKEDIDTDIIVTSHRYHGDNDYDLCLVCSETKEGKALIAKKKLQLIRNNLACHGCDFGSLLDWVPIIGDTENNYVLVNLNSESPYHHKYALSACDNHGRQGYYTIWDKKSIVPIIEKLNKITAENNENSCDKKDNHNCEWEKINEPPIKIYMKEKNMRTHYG